MKLFNLNISKQERDRIAAKIVVTSAETMFLFGAFWGFCMFVNGLVNLIT
jgi:hypothetical protein